MRRYLRCFSPIKVWFYTSLRYCVSSDDHNNPLSPSMVLETVRDVIRQPISDRIKKQVFTLH